MTRSEKKAVATTMARRFVQMNNLEGQSMAIMVMSAYVEGKAAGKAEERQHWEAKQEICQVGQGM